MLLNSASLAMAEMTTLTAAIYRIYKTSVKAGTEDTSPGITSRFEVFYDETMPKMKVLTLRPSPFHKFQDQNSLLPTSIRSIYVSLTSQNNEETNFG